ncbi:hypothetical protein T12_4778, partial [Trichinella patagoniensis]
MGALVAARLVHYTQRARSLPIHSITCWCDSEVALFWVRSAASRWKPFVQTRLVEPGRDCDETRRRKRMVARANMACKT